MTGSSKRQISQQIDSNLLRAAVLPVDKCLGMTSYDVIRKLKHFFPGVRIGHAGTLDPAASGLLLICLGAATRLVSWFQSFPKTYLAEVLLGLTTDSDDLDGKILRQTAPPSDLIHARLEAIYDRFRGVIVQTPPAVSAVKIGGKRAYDLARLGDVQGLKERRVTIHSLREIQRSPERLTLEITCSSGTYIRSIARDIGLALGCGACLASLRRSRLASFEAETALVVGPDRIPDTPLSHLIGLSACFPDWARCSVDAEEAARLTNGVLPHSLVPRLAGYENGPLALLSQEGALLAVIEAEAGGWKFVVVLPRLTGEVEV